MIDFCEIQTDYQLLVYGLEDIYKSATIHVFLFFLQKGYDKYRTVVITFLFICTFEKWDNFCNFPLASKNLRLDT